MNNIASDSPNNAALNNPCEPCQPLNHHKINKFLVKELSTPLLDEIYPHLWLVAKKASDHIDALHVQKIRGRELVPAENPKLYLIWQHSRIYIKPVPACLLSPDFWLASSKPSEENIENITPIRALALGFIRTYAFLIQHRLDFVLAQEVHLLPPDMTWEVWAPFIADFRAVEDKDVARHYHYGQMRLSRLNWVVRLVRPAGSSARWFYEIPYWSTMPYLQEATIPLVFAFAGASVALSCMQVIASTSGEGLDSQFLSSSPADRRTVAQSFWIFSLVALLLLGLVWALLFMVPSMFIVRQIHWGWAHRSSPNKGSEQKTSKRENADV